MYKQLTTVEPDLRASWDWTTRSSVRPEVIGRDGYNCWLTGQPIGPNQLPTLDHVIPRSMGGASTAANLRPAEFIANCTRGNSVDILVERQIGFKANEAGFLVPDDKMRLVQHKSLYYNVPKLTLQRVATGAGLAAAFGVAVEGSIQGYRLVRGQTTWNKAALAVGREAGLSAASGATVTAFVTALGIACPVAPALLVMAGGFVVGTATRSLIESGVQLVQGDITLVQAGFNVLMSPVHPIIGIGSLLAAGARLVGRKAHHSYLRVRRSLNRRQERWQSINFIRGFAHAS